MERGKNMKYAFALVFGFVLSVVVCAGDASIENVIVRQRWPWSKVVDIDFVVTGKATGIKFTAKYDGSEEFVLAEKDLSGKGKTAEVFEPGIHHLEWNPSSAGLGEVELKNFSVKAEPEDKTYLILNLYDGSYRYASSEPEGGWIADPANYKTNIVFRRIPKGTKKLGAHGSPDGLYKLFGFTEAYAKEHTATLTSDYYLSVFPITKAQQQYAETRANGGYDEPTASVPRACGQKTYNDIRGKEEDSISWPTTKYDVDPSSMIAKYRSIVSSTFPSEWKVDLPTCVQWEYAARATTPYGQIYSVGGDASTTPEGVTNLINQIAVWSNNKSEFSSATSVGQRKPNGWGLYDMIGVCFEWVADWYSSETASYSGVNPVGPVKPGGTRLRRSFYTSAPTGRILKPFSTAFYGSRAPGADDYGYRLCIHLKSLFKDE